MTAGTAPDELPEGEAKVRAVRSMFDAIAPRYDLVNRIMTFRMDVGWRRKTVRSLGLPTGARVLDLACGTGDLCRELQRQGYSPVGFDLSYGMLAAARTNAPLAQGDALRLPVADASVAGVSCGFALRNFAALEPFFAELGRAVAPGGRVALLEVAEPPNRLLRFGHGIYFGKVVPRVGGLLSDPAAYRYLPRSVAYLPPPGDMLAQLAGAGFAKVERRLLSVGIAQLITATRTASGAP
jgi:demethylmenaquinone methyltransferase/2-methoxy-6-polyprenyl-1,4-benzoquinol methylase